MPSENYEYSLGLNGLGTCATQYASEYFNARVFRDGFEYHAALRKGRDRRSRWTKKPADRKKTGSLFHWKPDLEVFTDIDIPVEYYLDTLKRQAVVNAGVTFRFRNQAGGKFETTEFCYEHGILDYITELTDGNAFTMPQYWETERRGRDRADKPEYKVKITAALCFSRNLSRAGILSQLLVARARRRAGQGRAQRLRLRHRRLSQAERQICEERIARSPFRMWRTALCS